MVSCEQGKTKNLFKFLNKEILLLMQQAEHTLDYEPWEKILYYIHANSQER